MFRKALLPILCAASFAAAIPLKVGESWVWQVSNRLTTDVSFRSARLIDSHSVTEGQIWRLAAFDSTTRATDTAKILVLPDGHQVWLRASNILRWELEPFRKPDSTPFLVDGDTSRLWGEAACGDLAYRALYPYTLVPQATVSDSAITLKFLMKYSASTCVSYRHVWSDSLGLERALTFPDLNASFALDWRLVSHDGSLRPRLLDSLEIPPSGTQMIWTGTFRGETQPMEIRWTLLETMPDSMEWTRVQVRQILRRCSKAYRITDSTPNGGWFDTLCTDAPSLVNLRLRPSTGQTLSDGELPCNPEWGWFHHWDDHPRPDSTISWGFNLYRPPFTGYLGGFERYDRKNGHVTYWIQQSTSLDHTSREINLADSLILLKVIPPGGDSSGTGIRVHTPPLAPTSLAQIASLHPSLPLRWSTASGRTGTLTASEIVQRPATLRGKTVFLQARLPDGRTWQGTHVAP